ncbi:MAG: hypothetical protein J6S63_01395 [Atopobiaceae bacterium]|nr:hypothetical protein [Atopobiaceae bacterium]
MKEELKRITKKLRRVADNIELEWDGKHEVVTYADLPLREVLRVMADELEKVGDGEEG